MSQISKRSTGGSGGGGIETINLDIGSITGTTVTLFAHQSPTENAGSSVQFVSTSSSIGVLNLTDASANTFLGRGAGNLATSGANNTSLGFNSLNVITSGSNNTSIGWGSLVSLTTGSGNLSLGQASAVNLLTGNSNTFLGDSSGLNYVSGETGNILIGFDSRGVLGDSFVTRIGNFGNGGSQAQVACFIDGITGVTVSNTNMVTIDTTTGQMGSQAVPSGGSVTVNGDSGSITGSTITIFANRASSNAGSTVGFDNTGTTSTLNVSDANENTIIGNIAGNASITGTSNVGLGFASLHNLTSGSQNIAVGQQSLGSLQTGSSNTVVGHSAMINCVSGSDNCAFGLDTLASNDGSDNTAFGAGNLFTLTTGSGNVAIGFAIGSGYTGAESNNILIGNQVAGATGELNVTRIGGGAIGAQVACFISGISGVTVTSAVPVVIDVNGQLGASTIGQTTVASVVSGSAVALTTATPTNITSISLIAGTYSISGIVNFTGAITVTGSQLASVNTISATIGVQGNNAASSVVPTAGFALGDNSVSIPSWILTIGSTTTVYLVAQATFSLGSGSAYGRISAIQLS